MKEEIKNPVDIICRARLSSVNLGILYSFMIKRISRGYSTAETSFLMGYSIDFIKQKEELKSIGFSFADMYTFKNALEENSLRSGMPNYEGQNYEADYLLIKTIGASKIDIRMFRLEEDKSETLVFHIIEENHALIRYKTSEEESTAEVKAIMNVLFEGRLFYTPQLPLTIYQRCRSAIGSDVLTPKYVQAALTALTKKKDFPKLKRVRSKDYGCMYEKVFE